MLKREIRRRALTRGLRFDPAEIISVKDSGQIIVFLRSINERRIQIDESGKEIETVEKKPIIWTEKMDGREPRLVVLIPSLIARINERGEVFTG